MNDLPVHLAFAAWASCKRSFWVPIGLSRSVNQSWAPSLIGITLPLTWGARVIFWCFSPPSFNLGRGSDLLVFIPYISTGRRLYLGLVGYRTTGRTWTPKRQRLLEPCLMDRETSRLDPFCTPAVPARAGKITTRGTPRIVRPPRSFIPILRGDTTKCFRVDSCSSNFNYRPS